MTKRKIFWIFCSVVMVVLLATACSSKDDDAASVEKNNNETNENEALEPTLKDFTIDEPVTLKMINWWGEEAWEEMWKDPVEAKFPNVTLEQIPIQPEPESLDEMYAENTHPDLFMGHFEHVRNLIDYDTAYDMRELMEMFDFDAEKFVPGLIDQIEMTSENGEIFMLPFFVDRYALHYNKDIFDLFGVDYPEDGMTYREIVELAKEVTGERNGTDYYGLQWQSDSFDSVGAHLETIDEETGEPQFTKNEDWKTYFELIEDTYEIPGNKPSEEDYLDYIWSRFEGDKNVAMVPLWYYPGLMEAESLSWGVTTYPTWDGFEEQSPGGVGFGIGITETSENKEAAFAVLQYLVSEEAVMDRFAEDEHNFNHLIYNPNELGVTIDEELNEYNVSSLFKHGFIPHKRQDPVFSETVIKEMADFIFSNTDVNTHLRHLSEKAEIYLEEEAQKK